MSLKFDTMKILPLLLSLFFSFSLAANSFSVDSLDIDQYIAANKLDAKAGPDGLYYAFSEKGKGAKPKPGDYIKLSYVGKMLDGTVFDQSEKDNPFVFRVGYRIVIQGWDKGVQLLPVGSKATLLVPASMAYGQKGLGKIPPNTPLLFEMEIMDILSPDAYDQYMMAVEKREREAYKRHVAEQFVSDKRLLNDYAADNKLRVKRTASGLSYIIKKKGKGDLLKTGDKIKVHYEGFLLDGTKFDSSYDRKEAFEFTLGTGKVIEGWDEGLQFFRRGGQGWLLIPSKLAYGRLAIREEGINIPGDSALVFKIKVE